MRSVIEPIDVMRKIQERSFQSRDFLFPGLPDCPARAKRGRAAAMNLCGALDRIRVTIICFAIHPEEISDPGSEAGDFLFPGLASAALPHPPGLRMAVMIKLWLRSGQILSVMQNEKSHRHPRAGLPLQGSGVARVN
jgi:hypothetical protein